MVAMVDEQGRLLNQNSTSIAMLGMHVPTHEALLAPTPASAQVERATYPDTPTKFNLLHELFRFEPVSVQGGCLRPAPGTACAAAGLLLQPCPWRV